MAVIPNDSARDLFRTVLLVLHLLALAVGLVVGEWMSS